MTLEWQNEDSVLVNLCGFMSIWEERAYLCLPSLGSAPFHGLILSGLYKVELFPLVPGH